MKTKNVRLLTFIGAFTFVGLFAVEKASATGESPQTFTLDGQLFQPASTTPLLDPGAKLTIQILNPSKTCILYEEEQTVDTTGSNGYFNIQVGSVVGAAKRTSNDPGRTMSQIFQNSQAVAANAVPGQTCPLSSYAPSSGDKRFFRLVLTPSATNVAGALSPDMVLDSVPNALVAQSVQGLEKDSILQVKNNGSTSLTQANLESVFSSTNYPTLQTLLAGSFVQTSANGASLPSFAADPNTPPQGSIWYDSVNHQVKFQSNTGPQVIGASGALGTMASESASDYLSKAGNLSGLASTSTARTNLGLGTASTLDVGVGNNNIVQLDGSAKLPAVDGSALTNLNASNIASGTLSASRLPATAVLDGGNSVSATMSLGTISNNDLALKTNNTTKMTVLANGNVGIGTTNPSTNLEVVTSGVPQIRIIDTDAAGSGIIIGDAGSGASFFWPMFRSFPIGSNRYAWFISELKSGEDTGSHPAMVFASRYNGANDITTRPLFEWRNNSTPFMTMSVSGNVGIGTTSPQATLDVNGLAKLKLNATVPATCNATMKGTLAMTSNAKLCFCEGAAWKFVDGEAACTW